MGGFVQYADPIPPGPHVYGPPPFGIWPTSVRKPLEAKGAPIAPSDILEMQAQDRVREADRQKMLFIEPKGIGQSSVPPPLPAGTPAPTPAAKDIAAALAPKQADLTMIFGGIGLALVGLGTRLFAQEKTTTQALASGAALIGGAGLIYKGLQR